VCLIARSRLPSAASFWTAARRVRLACRGSLVYRPHRRAVRQGGNRLGSWASCSAWCSLLVSSASRRARSSPSAVKRGIAEMHVAFAKARAADDRAGARPPLRQSARTLLQHSRPRWPAPAPRVDDATRAIIDGRDLIDVAERALLRPLSTDKGAPTRDRQRRETGVLCDAISPRDHSRRDIRGGADRACSCAASPKSMAVCRDCSVLSARAPRSALISPSPAVWRSAIVCFSSFAAHGIASRISARMGEGRTQRVLHGARRPFRACRLPAYALLRRQTSRRFRRRAVPVQQGRGEGSGLRAAMAFNRSA